MGGEIAQAIAAADIPVVVKDIEQKFVDAAIEKARGVTQGQLASLVKKEKLTQEQADAQLEQVMSLITGATDYSELRRRRLRGRGGAGEDGDQAGGLRRARRGHPGRRDPRLQHLLALDHRDRRGDPAPRQGGRLPLLLPGLGDAADRGDLRRGDLARDRPVGRQLRPGDPQAADRLRRGPRVRRQPHPQLRGRRDLARPGGAGALDQGDRRGRRRRQRGADGPLRPRRPARPRHDPPRRRAPQGLLRRLLLRPPGDEEAGRQRASSAPSPAARASTRTASRRSPATPSPTARSWPSCSPARR